MFCRAATGSYNQAGQGETPKVTQLSHSSSLPSVEDPKEATALTQSLNARTRTRTDVPKRTYQRSVPHPLGKQREHTQTVTTCENHRRHLSELMESGVLPRYSTLRFSLKVRLTSSPLNFTIMSYLIFTSHQMAQNNSVIKSTLLS